ncbi:MAG: DUF4258 domain-containing protein [Deltaproteobacteria bacterium]|nr:DUF4258 domain-containing protein [Deltaproteobacteria bacterium]MBW2154418.1 DUF4258 domain-containing protein [Deltaproteobacteria bacterium]
MIEKIKKQVRAGSYRFTIHAFERCVERGISPEQVKSAILSGEIIEDYPNDKYGPSCLIHGVTREQNILHVQCSIEPVWIVTVYDPTLNPEEWDEDYKTRRKKS